MTMLKELNKYENLGTPKFFHELFKQISSSNQPWTGDNVRQYFYNRIIDNRTVFDGCLPLAEAIGAIRISVDGQIKINPSLETTLVSERYLANKLIELILNTAKKDDIFHEIFCSENISYDIIYKSIQIENAAFHFRYANFRQLLVNFSFLCPHPDKNIRKLIINPRYKKVFDAELMPEIKRRKIGIEELERMLEQKQIHGKDAEIFVVGYEKKRLIEHPQVGNVEMISEYDIAAGFDIISYDDVGSIEYDRFIEVKSYSGTPCFHWSKNEIDVARIKKDRYFLYLVDRDKISDESYIPNIIQAPFKNVFLNESDWSREAQGWKFFQK